MSTVEELLHQGREAMDQGEFSLAAKHFRQLRDLAPDDLESHFLLGEALAEKGELEQAAESYRRGLELAPSDIEGRFALGDLLFELGRA